MQAGTYLKTEIGLAPIEASSGYWVAVEETTLDDVVVGETVGVWTDEVGKTWVDKTVRLNDLTKAMALGKMFGQLAIFDVVNNKEIEVK